MINLMNDYNQAAHPRVLAAIEKLADRRYAGYGLDEECRAAAADIRTVFGCPDGDVHLMPGGTLTNLTAIAAFLRPHQAVIAPATAHIYVHETGAIEAVGHKILTASTEDGRLQPRQIEKRIEEQTDEHMAKPGLVYLSQSTEWGTVYRREELTALRDLCHRHGMVLFVDGARLGYALMSERCDMSPAEFAAIPDAFYIGGTKNGLLFGEALVIVNAALRQDFRYLIKQRGGLLAKGFLLGAQFRAIFEEDLYFCLAKTANQTAEKLTEGLKAKGYAFEVPTESNQVFPIVEAAALPRLEAAILFERWHVLTDQRVSIRFVTTWATTEAEISQVLDLM